MKLIDVAVPGVAFSSETSDEQLANGLAALTKRERTVCAELIACLAIFDARRLYLPAGYASCFAYLTGKLGYSKSSAFRRITAARLHARMPVVGSYLAEGR